MQCPICSNYFEAHAINAHVEHCLSVSAAMQESRVAEETPAQNDNSDWGDLGDLMMETDSDDGSKAPPLHDDDDDDEFDDDDNTRNNDDWPCEDEAAASGISSKCELACNKTKIERNEYRETLQGVQVQHRI